MAGIGVEIISEQRTTDNFHLPLGWKVVRLGDAYKFTQKPPGLTYGNAEFIPFVPMEFVPIGRTFFDQHQTRSAKEIASGIYFEVGDILLAKITPSFENGKQGIIESLPIGFGLASTEIIPIQPIDGLSDKLFLFYYLLRSDVRSELAGKMEGSTGRQRLSKSTLADVIIPLPPLPEQRAIARALRAIQEAKEARRRELDLERERKAALIQRLFTHGTSGEPTKQTEIGEMPESWQVVRLEEVCKFTTGKLNSEAAVMDGQYPFFTCARETYRIDRYSFDQEAILLAGNNAQGVYSVKHYAGKFDAYQRTYIITISERNRLDYRFLLYNLTRKLIQLQQQSLGATTRFLTASIIGDLRLDLPPLEVQQQIAQILTACDTLSAALEREMGVLEELFKAMLEELMSGRLSALPLVDGATIKSVEGNEYG